MVAKDIEALGMFIFYISSPRLFLSLDLCLSFRLAVDLFLTSLVSQLALIVLFLSHTCL